MSHRRYGTFNTLKRCAWTVRVFWSPGEPILRTCFLSFSGTSKNMFVEDLPGPYWADPGPGPRECFQGSAPGPALGHSLGPGPESAQ